MALHVLRNKFSAWELPLGCILKQQTLPAGLHCLPDACFHSASRHVETALESDIDRIASEGDAAVSFSTGRTASQSSIRSGSCLETETRSFSGAETSSSQCPGFVERCHPLDFCLHGLRSSVGSSLQSAVAPLPGTNNARCRTLRYQSTTPLSALSLEYGIPSQFGASRGYANLAEQSSTLGYRAVSFDGNNDKATCAYLKGTPHNLLAADLVRYFREFGVKDSMIHPVYEENFRPHGWYIEFRTRADFLKAHKKTYEKGLGARSVRIEERPGPNMHRSIRREDVDKWRGTSVVVTHLPPDVGEESLERFFQGYSIAGNGIQIFRSVFEKRGSDPDKEPFTETRAVVKFATRLEAMRAWREKHLEVVNRRSVRLSLVK